MRSPTAGIETIGTYVPRYRLTAEAVTESWGQFHGAGISETAVPDADEDTLTMAAEAARNALRASDHDAASVSGLFLGTTTPPTEEEAMGPRLGSMLGLDDSVRTRQFTGSTRAGVDALVTGLDVVDPDDPVLVVASDAPQGAPDDAVEHAGGAGAVAMVLAPDAPGSVEAIAEHVGPYPGTRFRPAGSEETTGLGVTDYDRTAFVETVTTAVDALDAAPGEADAVALQSPNGKLPYRAAGPLGVDTDAIQQGTAVHSVGDTGTANPLLGLASALETGADSVVLVGYGSGGGATALSVEDGGIALETRGGGVASETERGESSSTQLSYGEYLRMQGEITPGEPDGGGAYVSVPNWKRTIPQRHRLLAGRCPECGTLAFPPEGACRDCGHLAEYEDVELPGTGIVEARTVIGQGGAPPEFVEQQARSGAYVSAVVALDGPDGGTVSIPTQVVGVEPSEVAIGDRVEATMRRIYTQEGVTRYGFKMRPTGE
jgi:hydroxymethylglutaryl-CoA synthase